MHKSCVKNKGTLYSTYEFKTTLPRRTYRIKKIFPEGTFDSRKKNLPLIFLLWS